MERLNRLFQKLRLGIVVAFGNPNEFALCKVETSFPLDECVACVMFVDDNLLDVRIVFVFVDYRETVVCGAVVQDSDLKIFVRLLKHTFYSLAQICGVVVVWDYDAYNAGSVQYGDSRRNERADIDA